MEALATEQALAARVRRGQEADQQKEEVERERKQKAQEEKDRTRNQSQEKEADNSRKEEEDDESDGSDISDSASEASDDLEDIYFSVAVDSKIARAEPVEQDIIRNRCAALRKCMRKRPCLPLKEGGGAMTYDDVASGAKLPLYTCPYLDCSYSSNDRATFLHHVAGGVSDRQHIEMLSQICKDDCSWMTTLDYVYGAVAIAERERWPRLGLCTTRRSLNALCQRFNDGNIQCVACFICCQLRTTAEGFPSVKLETPATDAAECQHEISMRSCTEFQELERNRPGSLLNNCSFDLWRRRYVLHRRKGTTNPLLHAEPISAPFSMCRDDEGRHISEWAVKMFFGKEAALLF